MFLSLDAAQNPKFSKFLGFDADPMVRVPKLEISLFIPCSLIQIFDS